VNIFQGSALYQNSGTDTVAVADNHPERSDIERDGEKGQETYLSVWGLSMPRMDTASCVSSKTLGLVSIFWVLFVQ